MKSKVLFLSAVICTVVPLINAQETRVEPEGADIVTIGGKTYLSPQGFEKQREHWSGLDLDTVLSELETGDTNSAELRIVELLDKQESQEESYRILVDLASMDEFRPFRQFIRSLIDNLDVKAGGEATSSDDAMAHYLRGYIYERYLNSSAKALASYEKAVGRSKAAEIRDRVSRAGNSNRREGWRRGEAASEGSYAAEKRMEKLLRKGQGLGRGEARPSGIEDGN